MADGLPEARSSVYEVSSLRANRANDSTFFWAGETFAPGLKAGAKGTNIQAYLQDHFLGAWSAVLDAVGDLDTVMGFEMMNEPHPGYIGLPTIDEWVSFDCDKLMAELQHRPASGRVPITIAILRPGCWTPRQRASVR